MESGMRNKLTTTFFALVLSLAAFTSAHGAASSTSVPFAQLQFVPCADEGNGELVLISGILHIVTAVNFDNAGGVHIKTHFQPQGATGTGLTTGDTYRAVGVTQEHFNVNAGGLPFTDTFVNNFRLIGTGGGAARYHVHAVFHITVNENGDVTANFVNVSVTCK